MKTAIASRDRAISANVHSLVLEDDSFAARAVCSTARPTSFKLHRPFEAAIPLISKWHVSPRFWTFQLHIFLLQRLAVDCPDAKESFTVVTFLFRSGSRSGFAPFADVLFLVIVGLRCRSAQRLFGLPFPNIAALAMIF